MGWPTIPPIINTDTANIYRGTASVDAEGGYGVIYPPAPSAIVPCSIQFDSVGEIVDAQQRVTQMNAYTVMFPSNPCVKARDMITWFDAGGSPHTAYVQSSVEVTGEGNCWEVPVVERI